MLPNPGLSPTAGSMHRASESDIVLAPRRHNSPVTKDNRWSVYSQTSLLQAATTPGSPSSSDALPLRYRMRASTSPHPATPPLPTVSSSKGHRGALTILTADSPASSDSSQPQHSLFSPVARTSVETSRPSLQPSVYSPGSQSVPGSPYLSPRSAAVLDGSQTGWTVNSYRPAQQGPASPQADSEVAPAATPPHLQQVSVEPSVPSPLSLQSPSRKKPGLQSSSSFTSGFTFPTSILASSPRANPKAIAGALALGSPRNKHKLWRGDRSKFYNAMVKDEEQRRVLHSHAATRIQTVYRRWLGIREANRRRQAIQEAERKAREQKELELEGRLRIWDQVCVQALLQAEASRQDLADERIREHERSLLERRGRANAANTIATAWRNSRLRTAAKQEVRRLKELRERGHEQFGKEGEGGETSKATPLRLQDEEHLLQYFMAKRLQREFRRFRSNSAPLDPNDLAGGKEEPPARALLSPLQRIVRVFQRWRKRGGSKFAYYRIPNVENLARTFHILDRNDDDSISLQEIVAGFKPFPTFQFSAISKLFQALDADNSLSVDCREFVRGLEGTTDETFLNCMQELLSRYFIQGINRRPSVAKIHAKVAFHDEMKKSRRRALRYLFRVLDEDCQGEMTLPQLKKRFVALYRAKGHTLSPAALDYVWRMFFHCSEVNEFVFVERLVTNGHPEFLHVVHDLYEAR